MFQFNRFDPQSKHQSTNKKKRRREPSDKHQCTSSLRVIAPEEKPVVKSDLGAAADEAFDELDIVTGQAASGWDEGIDDYHERNQLEFQSAIRISKMPIDKAAEAWSLAPFLLENLKRDGFEHFFPIQALTIPDVIASERHPHIKARDICITAPTGSGKTLSYVLPIINSLASRQVRRLRALVVLPSRDLADQVYQVFQSYLQGSDLKVGLAVGQSDFKSEQVALTVDPESSSFATLRQRLHFDPGNLDVALEAFRLPFDTVAADQQTAAMSSVDILVCTPGRLVDHLDSTPGFSLQHLRFICIDEADRLLNQSYHNWLDRVVASANSTNTTRKQGTLTSRCPLLADGCAFDIQPLTWRRHDADEAGYDTSLTSLDQSAPSSYCQTVQLRKFLVSATLTRDPQKLASLGLTNPKHYDLHRMLSQGETGESKKYSVPAGLSEYTVECTAEQKPVVLVALILESLNEAREASLTTKNIIVVFTSSVDSTHRLFRLLQLLWIASGLGEASMVAEFSSSLSQHERSSLIHRCKDWQDKLSVVVCSDGMARGMDIEHVSTVINYDVPRFAKNYVHRSGRCARAGKEGAAITLLKGGQVTQFTKIRSLIQSPETVRTKGVKKQLVRDVLPHYSACAHALRRVLEAETEGAIKTFDTEQLPSFLHSDQASSN